MIYKDETAMLLLSHWKHHKFVILIRLVKVVHEVSIQQSLDHSGDERSPNNVLPTEDPISHRNYQCKI